MTSFLKEECGASLRNRCNLVLICSLSVVIFMVFCVEQFVGKNDGGSYSKYARMETHATNTIP